MTTELKCRDGQASGWKDDVCTPDGACNLYSVQIIRTQSQIAADCETRSGIAFFPDPAGGDCLVIAWKDQGDDVKLSLVLMSRVEWKQGQ